MPCDWPGYGARVLILRVAPRCTRPIGNTAVVQGAVVADPETRGTRPLVAGEAAVEVPTTLVTGLPISGSALYHTKRGTILALGSLVVDPETLAALHLPAEEAAVEIHLGLPANLTRDEESG